MLSSSAQASGSVTEIDLHEYARARSEMKVKLAFADGRVSYWSNGLTSEASTTSTPALPVPEPSMAWMLGPGLLVPGWRGRGKRPGPVPAL